MSSYDLGATGAAIFLDDTPYMQTLYRLPGKTNSIMQKVQQTFMRTLGYYGAYRLFKNAASSAMDFGAEVSNVASIANNFSTQSISKQILSLNSILGRSTELANAYYFAYSAGIRGTEAELAKFTGNIAQMAKTIRADLTSSMDSATSLMNAYGMSTRNAGEVSDWFYQVVKQGKTKGSDLAATLGLVVSAAAVAKIPINELGAAIATLTRGGVQTSRAMTSLSQVISGFLTPSKQSQAVAASLGIELSAASLQSMGLAKAIQEVNEKAGDNTEALAQMFSDARSFRAIASLAGSQAQTFQQILTEFGNKSGSMLEAFKIQTDNVKTTWTTAMVDMEKAAIRYGDSIAPLIEIGALLVSGTADVISMLSENKVLLAASAVAVSILTGKVIHFANELFRMPANVNAASASIANQTAAINAQTAAYQANTAAAKGNNIAKATGIGSAMFNRGVDPMLAGTSTMFNADVEKMAMRSKVESLMANARNEKLHAGNTLFKYKEQTAAFKRSMSLQLLYGERSLQTAQKTSKLASAMRLLKPAAAKAGNAASLLTSAFGGPIPLLIQLTTLIVANREQIAAWVYDLDEVEQRSKDLDEKLKKHKEKRTEQLHGRLKALLDENKITKEQFEQISKNLESGNSKQYYEGITFIHQAETGTLPKKKKTVEDPDTMRKHWNQEKKQAILNEAKKKYEELEKMEKQHNYILSTTRASSILNDGKLDKEETQKLLDYKLRFQQKRLRYANHFAAVFRKLGYEQAERAFQEWLNKETIDYEQNLRLRENMHKKSEAQKLRNAKKLRKQQKQKNTISKSMERLNSLRKGFIMQQSILNADKKPGPSYSKKTMNTFLDTFTSKERKVWSRMKNSAIRNYRNSSSGRSKESFIQGAFKKFIEYAKRQQAKADDKLKEMSPEIKEIKELLKKIEAKNPSVNLGG